MSVVFRGGRLVEHDRDKPPRVGGGTLVSGHTWVARSGYVIEGWGRQIIRCTTRGCEPVRSGQTPTGFSGWVWEVFEHFSGDVSFQDPCDLSHGFAFCESPGDVVAGFLVMAHAGDDHVIER
jgi:hypothetical protein